MKGPPDDFVVIIISHGRADRVRTYQSLRSGGYTGPVVVLLDDLDETRAEYEARYPGEVVVFDKRAVAKWSQPANNFNDLRSTLYCRNASFEVAEKLGFKHFIQLDDDYTGFTFRFDQKLSYAPKTCRNLDLVFSCLLEFFKATRITSLAFAQGGDYVGGADGSNANAKWVRALRKCMNSFICSTERPFECQGQLNEDVSTYVSLGSRGAIFLTTNQVSLGQAQTQSNAGGMTEIYLDSGTYVKSFYTVMFHPSSVKVQMMPAMGRIHHSVSWRYTVPKILSESYRKADA